VAGATALGMAALIGYGLFARPAQAGYVVDLTQEGPNVIATGSGPIDLTGLTFVSGGDHSGPEVTPYDEDPLNVSILTGPLGQLLHIYEGLTGPASFGTGDGGAANSASGDFVGMDGATYLYVPEGYVSDSPPSDAATHDNQTFSSLDLTPGIYKWTWGTGPNQNFTLVIGTVVPEPATWAMMLLGFAGLGFAGYRKSRRPAARAV
jgi:PEP-CTERM motif